MIKLKGNYLQAIEDFVQDFDHKEWTNFDALRSYKQLQDMLLKLHGRILYENDVHRIIQNEIIDFVIQHNKDTNINSEIDFPKSHFKTKLIEVIQSYPRKYIIRIELPRFPNWGEFNFEISKQIELLSQNRTHTALSSPTMSLQDLLIPGSITFLQIKTEGYGTYQNDSPATADAISLAKQCAFLLTTFRLMYKSYSFDQNRATIETVTPSHTQDITQCTFISRCFGMVPNEDNLTVPDIQKGLSKASTILGSRNKPAETLDEKKTAFNESLSKIRKYFSLSNHQDFASIAAAIEWYQDSVYSDNQTFSYLAACIGLEALLGAQDHMDNLSKRLADRYAALMGKGRTERNNLAKEYESVLKLRGQIVHAKEARLTDRTNDSLNKVQDMLLNVIWRELHEMYKS